MANTNFCKRSYLVPVVLLLLILSGLVLGQTRTKHVEKTLQRSKVAASVPVAKRSPSPSPMVPVALVSALPPEYMSGEANVTVKGNQNPIIRLGLAQNGVNVIEFPAADSFFMIHPGNSELVSFDEETAKRSKRSLVLRPGSAFVAPPVGSQTKGPSASISVQMQSGVVVTFLIYPVRELSQNAHRCVVMYNREEVVAARKMAGLAVNLDGREPSPKRSNGSVRFADDGEDDAGQEIVVPKLSRLIAEVDSTRADERVRTGKDSSKRPKFSEVAATALRDVIKNPNKVRAFGKPNPGLSMALMPVIDLDVQSRIIVIAVRNDGGGKCCFSHVHSSKIALPMIRYSGVLGPRQGSALQSQERLSLTTNQSSWRRQ